MEKRQLIAAALCSILFTGCSNTINSRKAVENSSIRTMNESEEVVSDVDETSAVSTATVQTTTTSTTTATETTAASTKTTAAKKKREVIKYVVVDPVADPDISMRYWRSQLSEGSQKVYDSIYRAAMNFQGQVNINGSIDFNEIQHIVNSFYEDHPEVFWVSSPLAVTGSSKSLIGLDNINNINSSNYDEYKQRLDAEVNNILNQIPADLSTYEKVERVHDIIIDNTVYPYDPSSRKILDSPVYHTSYGCLVGHRAVCEGYSLAFKLLMDKLGIKCGIVYSEPDSYNLSHCWNYVLIDGEYFWVDATWDDPAGNEQIYNNNDYPYRHKYLCISDRDLLIDHTINYDESLFVPQCTSDIYKYGVPDISLYGELDDSMYDEFGNLKPLE